MARDSSGARGRAAAVSALKKQGANADTYNQAYQIYTAKFGEGDRAAQVAAKKMGISWETAQQYRSGGGGGGGSTSAVVNTPTTPTGMTGSSSSVVGVPTTSPTLAEQRPSPTLAEQRRISRIMGLYS